MPIMVNGTVIRDEDVFAEMQFHPAETAARAQHESAEALVVRELLIQEAHAQGFGEGDDAIEALLAKNVTVPTPDEATCQRYFENNRARFRIPDLIEAQHILIAAAPDDEEARVKAKAKAMALVESIARHPGCLGELARAHSDCPSKANDGHLGQVGRGSLVPELETYMFAMKAGETCPVPVPSRYGWHIVRVLDRIEGRDLPFESVQNRVADYLTESAWRRAVSQYIAILAGRASIDGFALRAARTPLVQ